MYLADLLDGSSCIRHSGPDVCDKITSLATNSGAQLEAVRTSGAARTVLPVAQSYQPGPDKATSLESRATLGR